MLQHGLTLKILCKVNTVTKDHILHDPIYMKYLE